MSEFINTIDAIGDEQAFILLVDRTVTEYFDDNATRIGDFAFTSCKSLTSADFPLVTTISEAAFDGCSSLTSVNFPLATYISNSAFDDCSSLTSINFPSVNSIGNYTFRNCSTLTSADFPLLTKINDATFRNCSKLTSLILRKDAICTLSNTNAFTSTPIASGTGYIYVPSALVDSYKAATNWSTYANQFRALEDYTVDGTITGELDATKI